MHPSPFLHKAISPNNYLEIITNFIRKPSY